MFLSAETTFIRISKVSLNKYVGHGKQSINKDTLKLKLIGG